MMVGVCGKDKAYLPFQKTLYQMLGRFLLAHRGDDDRVVMEVGIVGEESLMLMRILFGCH